VGSILLVESDVWADALRATGHAVLTVPAPHDAMDLLRDGGIDVVLIDSDNTTEILELARAIEHLPDAPSIILVSASPAAPETSARIGAATFLPRPCERSEVIASVTRLFDRMRPIRTFEDEPTGRTQLG
jgi:DNA-binding response OmpR family regulator